MRRWARARTVAGRPGPGRSHQRKVDKTLRQSFTRFSATDVLDGSHSREPILIRLASAEELGLGPHVHLAKAFDGLALSEVFELEKLTDLDLSFLAVDCGIREALGPFDRLVPRLHLDDRVAGDQLFGLRERPVCESALAS